MNFDFHNFSRESNPGVSRTRRNLSANILFTQAPNSRLAKDMKHLVPPAKLSCAKANASERKFQNKISGLDYNSMIIFTSEITCRAVQVGDKSLMSKSDSVFSSPVNRQRHAGLRFLQYRYLLRFLGCKSGEGIPVFS